MKWKTAHVYKVGSLQACSFAVATSGVQSDFSAKNNMLVWRKCIVWGMTLLLEMIPIHN